MPRPFAPMLVSPAASIPAGDGFVHEVKVDGFRCCAQVADGRLRLWSRGGTLWPSSLVPELAGLVELGDVVLDGELAVVCGDGRADFELLSRRMLSGDGAGPAVSLFVFDVLARGGVDLVGETWQRRRAVLEALGLADVTGGRVVPVLCCDDGAALFEAVAAVDGEGCCHKARGSTYRAGRSRSWLKTKRRATGWFALVGVRPPSGSRPAAAVVAEGERPLGAAVLALPGPAREALASVLERYGARHPTGTVTVPAGCVEVEVRYTSRTPTNGLLREAAAIGIRPAGYTLGGGHAGDSHWGREGAEPGDGG